MQVGELPAGLQLGGVSSVQGLTFAGGVGAGASGLLAGAGLGLAGAGDLGLGADAGRCRVVGGVAGLLLAGSGFGTGGGDRCFRAGAGGADRRGGIGRCGCGAGFGMAGACPGRLLQAAGGVEGLEGGLQFLAGFGGLGVRDDGGCLGTAPAGVGISELRADMRRVEQRGFSAGVPASAAACRSRASSPDSVSPSGPAARPSASAVTVPGSALRAREAREALW